MRNTVEFSVTGELVILVGYCPLSVICSRLATLPESCTFFPNIFRYFCWTFFVARQVWCGFELDTVE